MSMKKIEGMELFQKTIVGDGRLTNIQIDQNYLEKAAPKIDEVSEPKAKKKKNKKNKKKKQPEQEPIVLNTIAVEK